MTFSVAASKQNEKTCIACQFAGGISYRNVGLIRRIYRGFSTYRELPFGSNDHFFSRVLLSYVDGTSLSKQSERPSLYIINMLYLRFFQVVKLCVDIHIYILTSMYRHDLTAKDIDTNLRQVITRPDCV